MWVNLQVGVRSLQPGVVGVANHQGHGKSNAQQRCNIRPAAVHFVTVTEKVTDLAIPAEVVENTSKVETSEQEASNKQHLSNVEEKVCLESENKLLKQKVKDMEKEVNLSTTILQ